MVGANMVIFLSWIISLVGVSWRRSLVFLCLGEDHKCVAEVLKKNAIKNKVLKTITLVVSRTVE